MSRGSVAIVIALTLALPLSVRTMQPGATGSDRAAWVLFVDDLHVEFANTGRVRAFVQAVASDVIRATDTVAIRTSGPSGVATRMGSRGGLIQAIRELYGAGLKLGDLRGDRIAEETDLRARLAMSSARAAVELLAETEPQLRGLIYIGNGPWQHLAGETQAFADAVRRSGVTVFVINARSLEQISRRATHSDPAWNANSISSRDNLRIIAETTGGVAILDGAGTPAALATIRRGMPR